MLDKEGPTVVQWLEPTPILIRPVRRACLTHPFYKMSNVVLVDHVDVGVTQIRPSRAHQAAVLVNCSR